MRSVVRIWDATSGQTLFSYRGTWGLMDFRGRHEGTLSRRRASTISVSGNQRLELISDNQYPLLMSSHLDVEGF